MSEIFIQRTSPGQQLSEFQSKVKKDESKSAGADFGEVLNKALEDVNEAQKISSEEIQKVVSGELQDVHSAMVAMQKANLSFQMMMQVRNKLVDAYQEIMRMQV